MRADSEQRTESPAPGTLAFVDRANTVTNVVNSGTLPGLEDAAGQPWRDVFADWKQAPPEPNNVEELPACREARGPGDEAVTVEYYHGPSARNGAALVAVLRTDRQATLNAKQQELSGLGEVSAKVAHEINNAVTLLSGWLNLMHADMQENEEHYDTMALLVDEAERVGRLTRNILDVARGMPGERADIDVGVLLMEALSLVRYDLRNRNIAIETDIADELPIVCGSAGRLKQGVINLLMNARDAMPEGGRLRIIAARHGGAVRIEVADTGCGIPADALHAVFSPFYTTKPHGTGLGLPVVRKIVADHGGRVKATSEPGRGTRFVVQLPAKG